MAPRLPGVTARRPGSAPTIIPPTPLLLLLLLGPAARPPPSHTPLSHTPSRAATMIRRPKRPYMFTQIVQQTDGATYTMRTTSPLALYRATKDTRNHVLWQPSDHSLRNVEADEAGKLAAFRGRFGRSWDVELTGADGEAAPAAAAAVAAAEEEGGGATPKKSKKQAPGPSALDQLEAASRADEGAKGGAPPQAKRERKEAPPGDALSELISSYHTPMPEPGSSGKKKKK
ncbi:hypothetical protein GGS23DRAFT_594795 [Durotheca rogersii]|uniref:uncharacterized protein n=1 Tax=Durotheca rogersii TaxID=419775 RepID=UPI002220AD99|nr:uncharacterized protein GGS23DRAFT_594795 [Durotheca rogersii]KAI5865254.1 hypothetical protein GGS23DRAFT_594795 [Durotheca rogersii]